MRSSLQTARLPAFATATSSIVIAAWAVMSAALCCVGQNALTVYPVDGIVENAITHEPIARVLVEGGTDAVLTDDEGRFELHLPAGNEGITIRRPGYDTGETGERTSHLVSVAQNMTPLTFYLAPAAGISGHVTLSTGDDASGLQFIVYRESVDNGHAHWINEKIATTGMDGSLNLPSLDAPASYLLCNMPSADSVREMVEGRATSGFAGACFPGDSDLMTASAAPLRLAPGQQAQIQISLEKQNFYPVEISVAGGVKFAGGIQLFERSGQPMPFGMGRSAETGRYELSLPNGSYYAEARQWGPTQFYGRVDFTVAGAPVSGLTIVPSPVVPISVEIDTEFTAKPGQIPGMNDGGVGVLPSPGYAGSQVNLSWTPMNRPLDSKNGTNMRPAEPGSQDGRYLVDPPPPGTYRLEAFGVDTYVSSMTSGGTDLLSNPLVIGSGQSVEPIRITLRNDVGSLDWNVKPADTGSSGSGASGGERPQIYFYVISLSGNQQRIHQSTMQMPTMGSPALNGSIPFFNLIPLPPGSYLAAGFYRQQQIDLDNPEQMSWLASHGQAVTIQPGAVTDVQVEPISGDAEAASQ